jgi:hypothetical protein
MVPRGMAALPEREEQNAAYKDFLKISLLCPAENPLCTPEDLLIQMPVFKWVKCDRLSGGTAETS